VPERNDPIHNLFLATELRLTVGLACSLETIDRQSEEIVGYRRFGSKSVGCEQLHSPGAD